MVIDYPPERLGHNSDQPTAITNVLVATAGSSHQSGEIPLGAPTCSANSHRGRWALYPNGDQVVVIWPGGALTGLPAEVAGELNRLGPIPLPNPNPQPTPHEPPDRSPTPRPASATSTAGAPGQRRPPAAAATCSVPGGTNNGADDMTSATSTLTTAPPPTRPPAPPELAARTPPPCPPPNAPLTLR